MSLLVGVLLDPLAERESHAGLLDQAQGAVGDWLCTVKSFILGLFLSLFSDDWTSLVLFLLVHIVVIGEEVLGSNSCPRA